MILAALAKGEGVVLIKDRVWSWQERVWSGKGEDTAMA